MNQQQIKHATARAEAIYKRILVKNSEHCTVKGTQLTTKEKLEALRVGDFKLAEPLSRYHQQDWFGWVRFSDHLVGTVAEVALKGLNDQAKRKYDAVVDQLILGSNEEALRLLKEFEDWSA